MTLNELLALIPEVERDLPLTVLDASTGYCFEVMRVEIEKDEYIMPMSYGISMSEATHSEALQILLSYVPLPENRK